LNPANIQDFLTLSAEMRSIAHKSCIIAGFFNNSNKIGKNDVFMHHVWVLARPTCLFWSANVGFNCNGHKWP